MEQQDMKSGARLYTITFSLAAAAMLASCAAPEQPPRSPVNDPNAPMRVSTARVSTAQPDPVGQLFNDGPRQVVTYSVNTDPLSVLFRDPAFMVKLSPTTNDQRDELAATSAAQLTTTPTAESRSTVTPLAPTNQLSPKPVTRASMAPAEAPPVQTRTMIEPQAVEKTAASAPESMTSRVPVQAETQASMSSPTSPMSDAPSVAVAAATATVPAATTTKAPSAANAPVALDGLQQKSASWPIATKPANVFGAKGPDGSAWRGLVYKSPAKTPVKAIEPGKVVFAQPLRGYGNVIIIDHGKNYTSIYGYNEALTKNVGDTVRKGETIALVGDTGPLADEALYFEIRKGSVPIDPSIYLASNP